MDHGPAQRGGGMPAAQVQEPAPAAQTQTDFLDDYRQAVDISIREAKPMLVFFTLSNCSSSKRMQETTFCDEEIRRLSHRFVCVRINGSKEAELCSEKRITSFPTILFQNSREQELQRLSGIQSPDQLALQMHVLIQSTAAKIGSVVRK